MGMTKRTPLSGLLLIASIAVACVAEIRPDPTVSDVPSLSLVWPQPPARARIRFVEAVARPRDLGIRPSVWGRMLQAVRGTDEVWFVRPGGVAARGETIYVADPGAQALWILDREAGRFQRIHAAGEQALVSPVAVAVGPDDRVYVADSYLAKVFVYNGRGELQGAIGEQTLQRPAGLAYDAAAEHLYVADSGAHRVWIFNSDGTPAGVIGEHGDEHRQFNFPTHLALDRQGMLHVTNAMGFQIQRFTSDGRLLNAFGRHGDGSGDFSAPKGVGIDSEGHVYVVDALFDTVQIFNPDGQFLLDFGERGVDLGEFWLPGGLYIDERDRIYVADAYNQRIQIFEYLAKGDDE